MMAKRNRRMWFDARVMGDDGIGRVTCALLPGDCAEFCAVA